MRRLWIRPLLGVAVALVGASGAGATAASGGFAAAVGAYRLANGDVVALVLAAHQPRFVDYGTGAVRTLREQSGGLYVGGPGASVLSPVRVRVRLGAGGRISVDGRPGTRLAIGSKPASYRDGAVRLAGRLLVPAGGGRHPGIVIVPGSEPAHRTTYDFWAYFFAAHGFAVLTYDKRGVGDSGGTFDRSADTANLEQLAADALAGLDWLRRQPEVDPTRVGLDGASQGGWVVEIAAARSSAVRFATLQSAPAMSVGRQLAYAAATRQGWIDPPPSAARIAQALARVPDSGYDPRAAIAALRIPVLWQLGSVDKRIDTAETLTDLHRIDAAGRHAFTIRVYPGGAHSLRETPAGLIRQEQASPGLVPGVFPDLASWLRVHAGGH